MRIRMADAGLLVVMDLGTAALRGNLERVDEPERDHGVLERDCRDNECVEDLVVAEDGW